MGQKAGEGWRRLAKAGEGWRRLAKAPLVMAARKHCVFYAFSGMVQVLWVTHWLVITWHHVENLVCLRMSGRMKLTLVMVARKHCVFYTFS